MDSKDLKDRLTPEQFRITQEKGTEPAFTGKYWNCHDDGVYRCVVCGHPLFSSETKFESGSGWPSFFQPLDQNAVKTADDSSHGMRRTEVMCEKCGAQLVYEKACPCPEASTHSEGCCGQQMKQVKEAPSA